MMFNLIILTMKRLYLVLFGIFSVFLLSQCGDSSSSCVLNAQFRIGGVPTNSGYHATVRAKRSNRNSSNPPQSLQAPKKVQKKSVVLRVATVNNDLDTKALLFENGDKIILRTVHNFFYNEVEYAHFLNVGDTVIYKGNEVLDIIWKKD